MTTKEPARRKGKTAPCDYCGSPVLLTRPSKTGLHFCTRDKDCQAAKQRALSVRRATNPRTELIAHAVQLVAALAHRDRVKCPDCGLTNALPGYAHPTADGGGCQGTGATAWGGSDWGLEASRAIWPRETTTWEPDQ